MKSDRRIYAVAVLLLSGLVPAENLRPQPSFESVLLQAIEDLPNGGQVDLVPKVDGHVSVVTAFDPLLAFFRTTMPPPTSSRLFDSHSLQEKRHGESQHITTRPRSKEALGEVKSKKKRRPRKKLYGISKQKLDLTPVDQPPNTTVKKKNEFRVSSESDLTKKYRGEGNFRTRTVRPYIHIGGHEQSKAVRSRFVASPIVSHHVITTPRPFKILKSDLKRTKQIQVEPSPVLHEEEHNFRPPSRSLLSAEPIMKVNDPIALRPLPASLYNAPKFCKKCFKHWMEKAPGATDTELLEYCCVTGYNKRRLG